MTDTLQAERDRLYDILPTGEKTHCKACDQEVELHERTVYGTIVKKLLFFYREHGTGWFKPRESGDFANVAGTLYGLLESSGESGTWRISQRGIDFIYERTTVPRKMWVYNKKVYKIEDAPKTIVDCLKRGKFKLDEFRRARPAADARVLR